jgi:hypothetical protein
LRLQPVQARKNGARRLLHAIQKHFWACWANPEDEDK